MSHIVVAIIGAGNGGQAAAADLTLRGFSVRLYDVDSQVLGEISSRGGIVASGMINGFARLSLVTTDLKTALAGAGIVMVTVPRFAHRDVALQLASLIERRQQVFLNPGSTAGALEFAKVLWERGRKEIVVSSTATLPFAARVVQPGDVLVSLCTKTLFFASFPGCETESSARALKELFPAILPVANELEVSLNNGNPITHPVATLLNSARIENSQGDFLFYREGMSPAVARINSMLDEERLSLCSVLGFAEIPATERLFRMGYANAVYPTLLEAYQTSPAFSQIKAPKSLEDRYILEDVPHGLVFFASLGDVLGVPMKTTKKVVEMANLISGRDFWDEGITLDKLGLGGLTKGELVDFLQTGVSDKVSWASAGG